MLLYSLKIALAVIISLFFFSLFLYPLKRLVGYIGHPILGWTSTSINVQEGPYYEVSRRHRESLFEWIALMFFNYILISFIFAFAAGAISHYLSTRLASSHANDIVRQAMIGGFSGGLLLTASARVCTIQHSATLLRAVFILVLGVAGFFVCTFVLDHKLMTEFTDEAYKTAHANSLVLTMPPLIATFMLTELMILSTKRAFPISNIAPVELFSGLGQIYYERNVGFGEKEVRAMVLRLLSEEFHQSGLKTVYWVTVDYESEFLENLAKFKRDPKASSCVVKVITTSEIAERLRREYHSILQIKETTHSRALRCSRFLILNDSVGIIYQRIPPEGGNSANIAQVFDDFWEVNTASTVFERWFDSLP